MQTGMIDEQKLISELQQGSLTAFEAIYSQYWYPMFLVAYRKLNDREVAEEMVQDIFVKLWERKASVSINRLSYYLFSAVRYAVIDQIRARVTREQYLSYYQSFLSTEDSSTEEAIILNDLRSALEDSLQTLPEKSRQVFTLSYFENWSVTQIAHHIQLSEKAVEYHLTKAVKFLRTHYQDHLLGTLIYLILTNR
ncbi:RNA polymerase subunit sigma-24 [Siphonobacter sp. BAB-5405]|uniref:RNA polymerase sigma factor n=1 Tax=Siphonobacter sp. BAB-5405 TaxID=1864825 RepID=UPI000C800549|nr:RNA polymerase sigma-70 factor [Siphonobacter sp. BAB-5405]PMD90442.1 RNA polymerase subunit sigma-24 [Siphonobacter sp. BAB-5405]